MKYVPAPMTTEQVAELHDALWMALIAIPAHRHRTSVAERDCNICMGRKYLVKAYGILPDGSK